MIILVICQKYQIQFGVRSVLGPDWKPVPDSQWQCFMNKSNLFVLLGKPEGFGWAIQLKRKLKVTKSSITSTDTEYRK